LPEMPQAIDYSYRGHKKITTFTRFTYEVGHIGRANERPRFSRHSQYRRCSI